MGVWRWPTVNLVNSVTVLEGCDRDAIQDLPHPEHSRWAIVRSMPYYTPLPQPKVDLVTKKGLDVFLVLPYHPPPPGCVTSCASAFLTIICLYVLSFCSKLCLDLRQKYYQILVCLLTAVLTSRLPLDSCVLNLHCYSLHFDLSVKFLVPPFRILETTWSICIILGTGVESKRGYENLSGEFACFFGSVDADFWWNPNRQCSVAYVKHKSVKNVFF